MATVPPDGFSVEPLLPAWDKALYCVDIVVIDDVSKSWSVVNPSFGKLVKSTLFTVDGVKLSTKYSGSCKSS